MPTQTIRGSAKKYYYYDSKNPNVQYCTTTNTGRMPYESGEELRYTIMDSGDYTGQLRDTDDGPYWGTKLPISALGRSRI